MRKAYQQLDKHSHILKFYGNVLHVNGVFHYPAFFEGGNNDPANAFVLESMGSREMIPIPSTSLYICGSNEKQCNEPRPYRLFFFPPALMALPSSHTSL